MSNEIEIISDYWNKVDSIPDFIDNKKWSHKKCFDLARDIFNHMSILFESTILKDSKIILVYKYTVDITTNMLDIEPQIGLSYYFYIKEILEDYLIRCEENELYETCSNIRNLLEYYCSEL